MTAGGRGGRAVCFSRPQARLGGAFEGHSERQTLADRRLRHPAVHPAFSLPLLRCLVSPRADAAFIANPQKAAERLWRRAGVSGARVHDLRRTAASYMAAAKVPRLVIGKILNHTEREITATYDRFAYDSEKRQAVEIWESRLRRTVGRDVGGDVVTFPRASGE